MKFSTLEWIGGTDGHLRLLDQRRLPGEVAYLDCRDAESLYEAIVTLAVRGAPAIGVAAGYGVCLAMQAAAGPLSAAIVHLERQADYLASSRPTAVNLFWALDRMRRTAERFAASRPTGSVDDLRQTLLEEAHRICREDKAMCRRIGLNGQNLIREGSTVLTHCNAGALATAGIGTALAPMYVAAEQGRLFSVYVDETRPLLQGSRLSAWELAAAGLDVTLICDNMAGMLMKEGRIDAVITGADRIAANGDTANKIGTYALSVLAAQHGVPFYIAAPSSTFDLNIRTGREIPIEQRRPEEVRAFGERPTAPPGVRVYNPAFDVVDAERITAIVTERGVIERPDADKIRKHLESQTPRVQEP